MVLLTCPTDADVEQGVVGSGAAIRATPWPLHAGCVRACRQDGGAMRRRGAGGQALTDNLR